MTQQLLPFQNAIVLDLDHRQVIVLKDGSLRGYGGIYYSELAKAIKLHFAERNSGVKVRMRRCDHGGGAHEECIWCDVNEYTTA